MLPLLTEPSVFFILFFNHGRKKISRYFVNCTMCGMEWIKSMQIAVVSSWGYGLIFQSLSKAINLCFEMRAIYTAVYFQQSSRTARCCGPISSAKTQCACGAGFDSHYISIAWYVHTCWGFKSRGRTWHVFLTTKFLPGKITPHLDFACCC